MVGVYCSRSQHSAKAMEVCPVSVGVEACTGSCHLTLVDDGARCSIDRKKENHYHSFYITRDSYMICADK